MSVQINNTIIRFKAKVLPALGCIILAEKLKYSEKKHLEISMVLICFMLEICIITPKNINVPIISAINICGKVAILINYN